MSFFQLSTSGITNGMKIKMLIMDWKEVISKLEYFLLKLLLIIVYITQESIAQRINKFPLNIEEEKFNWPLTVITRYTPVIDKIMQKTILKFIFNLYNNTSDSSVKIGTAATIMDAFEAEVYIRPVFSKTK